MVVFVYVGSKYRPFSEKVLEFSKITQDYEVLTLTILKPNFRKLVVVCVYKPPKGILCMNFGIYKTFTFHINMPKDPLSSSLLRIYCTFAFKSKGLKGDLFVIFT